MTLRRVDAFIRWYNRYYVKAGNPLTQTEILNLAHEKGLSDQDKSRLYGNLRANYRAQVHGRSVDYAWRVRRKGVKGFGRHYRDMAHLLVEPWQEPYFMHPAQTSRAHIPEQHAPAQDRESA